MNYDYTPNRIYKSRQFKGRAVIISSNQFYVSARYFKRVRDANDFANGRTPEIAGMPLEVDKNRFMEMFSPPEF
jgi:hypothetical protein